MVFLVSNTVIAKPKDTTHDGGCKLRIKSNKISFLSVCSNSCCNLLRRCVAHSMGLVVKVERIRDVFGNTWMRERPTGQDNTKARSSPPLRHNSTDSSFCVDAKGRIRAQAHGRRRNLNQNDWSYRLVRTNYNSIQDGDVRLCVDLKKLTNCQTGTLYAS